MSERPGRAEPKYQHIADVLRAEILAGQPPAGSQIQTKLELQARFAVAVNTVERAIEVLRREGLVESRQGAGMYALQPPEPAPGLAEVIRRLGVVERDVADLRRRLPDPGDTAM